MNKRHVLLALLAITPAFSQDSDKPSVSTEIVTIALDEQVAGLYFHNGKDIAIFQANSTGLGEAMRYKGPPRLLIRNSEAEFSQKPQPPAPCASVDLPLGSNRVLLACLKTADSPMRITAYDIGGSRIGAGDYRFFNFSHSVISAIMGDRKFAVKPGTDTLVTHAAWKDEVMEIDIELALIKANGPKPVYSSQWGHRPGRRNFIFMFDGPQEYNPIRICRFFDVPPTGQIEAKP